MSFNASASLGTVSAAFFTLSSPGGSCAVVLRKSPRTGEQGRSCKLTPGACTRPLAGVWWGAAGVRQMPRGAIRPNRQRTANINKSSRASPGGAGAAGAREERSQASRAGAGSRLGRAGAGPTTAATPEVREPQSLVNVSYHTLALLPDFGKKFWGLNESNGF